MFQSNPELKRIRFDGFIVKGYVDISNFDFQIAKNMKL